MLKSLSLLVGWLNAILGVLLPALYWVAFISPPDSIKWLRHTDMVSNSFDASVVKIPILILSCLLLLWPMTSLLLVQGISQNRRSFMVPWICLTFLLLIMLVVLIFSHLILHTGISDDSGLRLTSSILLVIAIGCVLLSLTIVCTQYGQMRRAPIIVPLQCPTKTEMAEEMPLRYMPIFDN